MGKDANGKWLSHTAAKYPPQLALALANALPSLLSASAETEEQTTTPTKRNTDNNADTGNASKGPRPDGGTFSLRRNRGYAGTEGTYARDADNLPDSNNQDDDVVLTSGSTLCSFSQDVCAVIPNSITGRTLQAVAQPPDLISPKGRKAALKQNHDGWIASEAKELDAHKRNESWLVIPFSDVPCGRRIIRMLWVYKIKRDGTLKARLCVMGSSQKPGVDFDQTYCATMRASSLRLLAAISAALGLSMRRIDFISAYLQGKLEEGEVVYCQMPEGYETVDSEGRPHVLRIIKPIYGLAQAGRRWQRSIFPWLKEFGFQQSEFDPCIFFWKGDQNRRNETILLGCYVDDLLICTSHTDAPSRFRTFVISLQKDWEIDDEGEAVDLLNVHFIRTDTGIMLHQRPYIESMVQNYLPNGVPLAFQRNWTPCGQDLPDLVRHAMEDETERPPIDIKNYQKIVGALLYCATNTRPDIAYAVGMLCRAMSKPTPPLYKAATRVLHY